MIGFHLSIKGGIPNAVRLAKESNYSTFQIFTRSSRSWIVKKLIEKDVEEFNRLCAQWNYPIVNVHLPYLPNFATLDKDVRNKSLNSLVEEIERCQLLGIKNLVLHIGSHKGKGIDLGIQTVIENLNSITSSKRSPKILLETGAGFKNSVGSKFNELDKIFSQLDDPDQFGVCFDTCHVFAAGYDLRSHDSVVHTLGLFDDKVGLENIHLIHLNDSKGDLGQGLDRHEHIGLGKIGDKGFQAFLHHKSLKDIPMILETPNTKGYGDKQNFTKVIELKLNN
ncbi:MAG: deoxyribonuclease IV [Candidatus Hodarchaeales archaeon]